MKKRYVNPVSEAIVLRITNSLLAGAWGKNGETVTDEKDVLGREDDFDWDEEEEY